MPITFCFTKGRDYMKWAGSFVAQYAILHHFITNTAASSKLCWNCFTLTLGDRKANWLIFEKQASSADPAI